jgi:hypothetical protein
MISRCENADIPFNASEGIGGASSISLITTFQKSSVGVERLFFTNATGENLISMVDDLKIKRGNK